jgi:hypothetical protein
MSSQSGRRSSAQSPQQKDPKLSVEGRNADGSLKLKVTVPGLNSPENAFRTYTLSRGADVRPLQFEGEIVAEVERPTNHRGVRDRNVCEPDSYRAAIYKTRAGRFIAEFSTVSDRYVVDTVNTPLSERRPLPPQRDGKAEVLDSLDAACDWFRPGPLTTELLKKLGRWGPEIID